MAGSCPALDRGNKCTMAGVKYCGVGKCPSELGAMELLLSCGAAAQPVPAGEALSCKFDDGRTVPAYWDAEELAFACKPPKVTRHALMPFCIHPDAPFSWGNLTCRISLQRQCWYLRGVALFYVQATLAAHCGRGGGGPNLLDCS